jgi:hypothetical protein
MTVHSLFDSFLCPEQRPDHPFVSDADVVSVREANDTLVIAEVYKRLGGTFGFRFQTWVAWRDAGGHVRSHSWHEIAPKESLFANDVEEAQFGADSYAASTGIALAGHWHGPR